MTLIACYLCVCIFTFNIHIGYDVRVFLLSLWNRCRLLSHEWFLPKWPFWTLSSCENIRCVCTLFQCCFGWPESAKNLTDLYKRKKHPLSIKLSNTLNRIMWLILLVLHQVNHTFWALFYESVAPFNIMEQWGQSCDSHGWILCQGNQVQPHHRSF